MAGPHFRVGCLGVLWWRGSPCLWRLLQCVKASVFEKGLSKDLILKLAEFSLGTFISIIMISGLKVGLIL